LEGSLRDEEEWGGAELRSILKLLAEAAKVLQVRHGKSIFSGPEAYDRARMAWGRLINLLGPAPDSASVETVQGDVRYLLREPPMPPANLTPEHMAAYKTTLEAWYREVRHSYTLFAQLLAEAKARANEGEELGDSIVRSRAKN